MSLRLFGKDISTAGREAVRAAAAVGQETAEISAVVDVKVDKP